MTARNGRLAKSGDRSKERKSRLLIVDSRHSLFIQSQKLYTLLKVRRNEEQKSTRAISCTQRVTASSTSKKTSLGKTFECSLD